MPPHGGAVQPMPAPHAHLMQLESGRTGKHAALMVQTLVQLEGTEGAGEGHGGGATQRGVVRGRSPGGGMGVVVHFVTVRRWSGLGRRSSVAPPELGVVVGQHGGGDRG